jgi:hypothetical protein
MQGTETPYLFVACHGHSGSTLLENMLNTAPSGLALGEISHFATYFDEPAQRCGCGAPLGQCAFWRSVIEQLGLQQPERLAARFPTDGYRAGFGPRNWPYLALLVSPRPLLEAVERLPRTLARENGRRVHNHWRLVDAARERAGSSLIIDKSMSASRLVEIARKAPRGFRVCAIHLVRDGRANAHSHRKLFRTPIAAGAQAWRTTNTRIEQALASMPRMPRIRVRYEDLCAEPERELSRIAEQLGLPVRFDLSRFGASTHAVGGNYARPTGYRRIEQDRKWLVELSQQDRAVFEEIAGGLNRRYGYAD